MKTSKEVQYTNVNDLYLDPLNPRIGRSRTTKDNSQDFLLETMQEWVLEELAMSYLENGGFWAYEPLLVVEEKIGRKKAKVVVEGNRRLAALKTLKSAFDGNARSPKWKSIADEYSCPAELFESVPYVTCDSREDVTAFLGFRHVTGIKQWNSDEKAAYIAKLVQSGMSYQEVARKIGSKTPTVRKHFIAFRTLS
jgi:non-ribosomal peptide synthetase component E (peptide arylation enzyme)